MKYIIYLAIVTLISCSTQKKDVVKNAVAGGSCLPYFKFDSVDYYKIEISEKDVWSYLNKENKTQYDSQKFSLLVGRALKSFSDTFIVKDLEKLQFRKQFLSSVTIEKLSKIFCERDHEEIFATTCEPVYRDILVFRHDGKISGIASICFACGQSLILGSSRNTEGFGQSGDYGKLSELLKN